MAKNTSKAAKKGAISIKNVTKVYDPTGVNVMAVDNCSMEIAGGEVCMIVGPSGCGKTTLLNIIAGFLNPTGGSVKLGDNEILAPGVDRGMVFQQGALFEWLTVAQNVDFGLRMKGADPIETANREMGSKD